MTRTIVLTGARGGQGTSTAAAALALLAADHTVTALRSGDPSATAALLGRRGPDAQWTSVCPRLGLGPLDEPAPPEFTDVGIEVIDGGRAPARPWDAPDEALALVRRSAAGGTVERYAVLRGPCYIALSTLLNRGGRYDGIIVLAETGRALSDRDVTDVLGIPVVANIPVDPAIARSIDAGVFATSLRHHAAPFQGLHRLAQPRTGLSKATLPPDTDLPLPRRGRSGAKTACRARPLWGAVYGAWKHPAERVARVEHRQAVAGRR